MIPNKTSETLIFPLFLNNENRRLVAPAPIEANVVPAAALADIWNLPSSTP
jgi:hypothetical protein